MTFLPLSFQQKGRAIIGRISANSEKQQLINTWSGRQHHHHHHRLHKQIGREVTKEHKSFHLARTATVWGGLTSFCPAIGPFFGSAYSNSWCYRHYVICSTRTPPTACLPACLIHSLDACHTFALYQCSKHTSSQPVSTQSVIIQQRASQPISQSASQPASHDEESVTTTKPSVSQAQPAAEASCFFVTVVSDWRATTAAEASKQQLTS